jgi:GNAT superfamily N-acetyltransferase
VRQIQPGDTEALTSFFLALSPKAYQTRFPTRAVNTEFDHREPPSAPVIAATFTSGELSQHKCLVALNANNEVVGLIDYSASMRMGSMIGLHAPRCEVNIVVADDFQNLGLAPKLMQQAMNAAKADGYAQMVGYRPDAGTTRKVVLDLNKPLRAQNRPPEARKTDYIPPPPNDPFWPPEAWA